MKICESCGHQNWEPDKDCESCHRKFKQAPQCNPLTGHTEMVHDDGGSLVGAGEVLGKLPVGGIPGGS